MLYDVVNIAETRIIIAPDSHRFAELAYVLDQIEYEAVIVIDDENLHNWEFYCLRTSLVSSDAKFTIMHIPRECRYRADCDLLTTT